jgi:hypothetical protein
MKIRDQLNEIKTYYEMTRQVGHTTGMLNGVKQSNHGIVLVPNMGCVDVIKQKLPYPSKITFVSINSKHGLRGANLPLFIDNGTLWVLFSKAVEEIDRLKSKCGEK